MGVARSRREFPVTSAHDTGVRGAHLSKIAKGGATGCLPVQAKTKLCQPPHISGDPSLSVGSVMIQSGSHGFHNGAGCVIVLESPDVCAAQAVVPAFVHVEHFEVDGKRIFEVPESL